jgi:hypothetical protein
MKFLKSAPQQEFFRERHATTCAIHKTRRGQVMRLHLTADMACATEHKLALEALRQGAG